MGRVHRRNDLAMTVFLVIAAAATVQAEFGDITSFFGCYEGVDWFAYQPEDSANMTVADCGALCYRDGFAFAGMRAITGSPNSCECGCTVENLEELDSSLCEEPCSADPDSTYGDQCPSNEAYISIFSIATEDPFCNINQICDADTRELCEENLTMTYAIVITVLCVLVVAGVVFCFYKRHMLCRNHNGPSAIMKRQILQDQLIGQISTESLVQQVQQSWVIDFHKITMGKMIAAGSSGQVYSGVFDGKPVAVKELFSVLFDPESLKDFKDEASMLASLHHPHIVRFFGVATRSTDRGPAYYLITELKEQSLRSYMNTSPQPDRLVILRMASEVVSAIDFLHSRSVVHRDLKPENVLLDQFLSVFLCDFGIAKQMDASQRAVDMTSDMGTAAYMAPELASSKLLDDIDDSDLVIQGSFARQDIVAAKAGNGRFNTPNDGLEMSQMARGNEASARSLLAADKKVKNFRQIGKKVVVSMQEGSKVDIFAFGMLLYAMCAWKPPFSGHRPLQILAFITLQHRRPSLSRLENVFPSTVLDLISRAWAHNPKDRPTTDEIKGALNKCRAELVNGEGPKLLH